jgi:hypothetical protein
MVTLHSNYADFSNFHPFVITWLAASAACDVILSAALIYSLVCLLISLLSSITHLLCSTLANRVYVPPTAISTGLFAVRLCNINPYEKSFNFLGLAVTVQTGSITAVTALLDLFVFLFSPVSSCSQRVLPN